MSRAASHRVAQALVFAVLGSVVPGPKSAALGAQAVSATDGVSVEMTVSPQLTLTAVQPLAFGSMAGGSVLTREPGHANAGKVTVNAPSGFPLSLVFTFPGVVAASGPAGSEAVFTGWTVTFSETDVPPGVTVLILAEGGTSDPVGLLLSGTQNAEDVAYLRIGATLSIPPNATPGTYSAPIFISMDYQ